jgi:hypothetical protein
MPTTYKKANRYQPEDVQAGIPNPKLKIKKKKIN